MYPIVKINNLSKEYTVNGQNKLALNDVNIEINQKEFTALVGPSGSGKTTLLNIIGCIDSASSGRLEIDNIEIGTLKAKELAKLRNTKIGYIFQDFNLIGVLNVYDNVELPLLVNSIHTKNQRKELIFEALNEVGLEKFAHQKPSQLSGGQRQRVAIARALINNPSIIVADEPTANLDAKTAYKILDLMWELNSIKNTTFIFSTHDEKLINRVKRVITIKNGKAST